MGQGRPPKIYQLVQGVPLVGDLRLGREIGRGDCMQYKYIECPGCGKRRWVSIHRIITTSGRCTHCRLMQKAEKSNNWRGGAFVSPTGYKWVRIYPNDPFYHMVNNRGYVLEHRLVKARHIGRPLLDEEVVHHINENKLDNRIENLMLLPNDSEHHKIKHHHVAPGIQAAAAERFDELVKRD